MSNSFWGWVEVGFATADTVVDWITVGISWAQYVNINSQAVQMGNLIYSYLDSAPTAMFLGNDFFSFLWMIKPLRPDLTKLAAMVSTDWATNLAGSTAEPEVAAWLVPALGVISTILDIESVVLSTITLTQYV